jgi:MFS family permease
VTLRLALALDAIAVALLRYAETPAALGAFVVLHGLAIGTQIAVVPAIAAVVLGMKRFGTLFGLLQVATMVASAVGPVASGLIFDRTGQYGGAILMWLCAFVAATALGFWIPGARSEASVPPRVAVA